LVGINVEWLVSSMDGISSAISKEWLGLILLPAVSTLAECITSINVSIQDQLALSMSVAIGSTIVSLEPSLLRWLRSDAIPTANGVVYYTVG
jgi:Ca2+/H+ antiporter